MKKIIEIIKTKYNIKDINHLNINNLELLEFNINVYAEIKILKFKFKDEYNIILTILNSNLYPAENITINLEYTYDKLLNDLENFHFRFL